MPKVYLVGAGPGALDYLTLKAFRVLQAADIVLYDALVTEAVLQVAQKALLVFIGKRCGVHSIRQADINEKLIAAAQKHSCVVRLKGGDPSIFARLDEEITALKAQHIDFEIIPGVTAASAAAANLKIPLTKRDTARNICLLTPRVHLDHLAQNNDWIQSTLCADTVVIYMGKNQIPSIATQLIQAGMPLSTSVVIAEAACTPQTKLYQGTLDTLSQTFISIQGPAVLILSKIYDDTILAELPSFAQIEHI